MTVGVAWGAGRCLVSVHQKEEGPGQPRWTGGFVKMCVQLWRVQWVSVSQALGGSPAAGSAQTSQEAVMSFSSEKAKQRLLRVLLVPERSPAAPGPESSADGLCASRGGSTLTCVLGTCPPRVRLCSSAGSMC